VLDLETSESEMFNSKFDHSVRKAVHKAEREGLNAVEESSEACLTQEFYPRYLRMMKHLGTPPHPLEYFVALRRHLPDRLKVFWAVHQGRFVSGLMGISTGKRANILHIVSDEEYHHLRPNDLVHWRFIQWARNNGYKWFDFGVARYEGQRQFKKKWGTILQPYRIAHFSTSGKKAGVPLGSHRSVVSWLWANLVPLRVTALLGKHLRKVYTR